MNEIYSDEDIQKVLSKIRRIAKMSDDDAIEEVKEFTYKIFMDYKEKRNVSDSTKQERMRKVEYEESIMLANENIKEVKKRMRQYEKEISNNTSAGLIRADDLEEYIASFEDDYAPEIINMVKDELANLKQTSANLITKLRTEFYLYYLETFEDGASSPNALKGMKKAMKEIKDYLESQNIYTDDINNQCRNIMEKRARSRAEKKLLALEVARDINDGKKIIKLKKEAEIILKQDWKIVFPNEEPPIVV